MVPAKRIDTYAITMMQREIRLAGYSRIVFKSVQEPSIPARFEVVKREGGEAARLTGTEEKKRKGEFQIIAEESHFG